MGFEIPMPVQQEVIPFLLQDTRDLVALAHTGTGKTAAYGDLLPENWSNK
jgi:ATP-dependent RNA helicase DeaD